MKDEKLINVCNECFLRKKTLDRRRLFARMPHHQFWHALNGLASFCDFGDITTTLISDTFFFHLNNKNEEQLVLRSGGRGANLSTGKE